MTTSAPTVSVVIPCYNLGAYLDQAVQSVLDQTYRDFEIVIIDDGSTDPATRHLFDSYQRPRTRIFRTANQGLARARNLGLREANGRYLSFLDADDLLEPTFLDRTVARLEDDPLIAFASCWLKAFGESAFLWTPTTCTFPHLLAEDTVCTAALTRKEALIQVGGFDPAMPVAGYEDWDLAISLVESGLRGLIVPEVLFRYRSRIASMTGSCTAPANHARLMQYLVDKHAAVYRANLSGVMETIENRTVEWWRPGPAEMHASAEDEFVEPPFRVSSVDNGAPHVSIVITCGNQSRQLPRMLESIISEIPAGYEFIIVTTHRHDPITPQLLECFENAGIQVIQTAGSGLPIEREAGLMQAKGDIVFAMDVNSSPDPKYLFKAILALDNDPNLAFVTCGVKDAATGFVWAPASIRLTDWLACPRVAFPVLRRSALDKSGGYDGGLTRGPLADWDLIIRLTSMGYSGELLMEETIQQNLEPEPLPLHEVIDKHSTIFDSHWKEAILGQENMRRRLQAHIEEAAAPPPPSGQLAPVDWGGLRRLEPVSAVWGIDRGQPIDRFYIEQFLDQYRDDIHGRVLEVKDPVYTSSYGNAVQSVDIVDIARNNPTATLICDLAMKDALPENAFDCFVLTQTLHIIYDIRQVLENAHRTLRPGGVLLATLPCVSRVDYESGLNGDCWRFTPAAATRLFGEVFGPGQVEVKAYGNVLACCAFLMGISVGELTPEELNHRDLYFPLVVCVRAAKATSAAASISESTAGRESTAGSISSDDWGSRSPQDLLGALLSEEEEISHLLRTNYALEQHMETWSIPEICRRTGQLRSLREKLQKAKDHHLEPGTLQPSLQEERGGEHPTNVLDQHARYSQEDWGDFQTIPISPEWGADRGRCIDRYYIEQFLEENRNDIHGSVLEVHDCDYTIQFGANRVQRSDVIDINPSNPRATIVGDLRNAHAIQRDAYDCFIMTQTLHVIYDMRAVLAECVRILKPNGTLLVTLPCASKIAHEQGLDGDFWRFTEAAAWELFTEFFPRDRLEIRSHGNVLVTMAYLYGMACHELAASEFELNDPSCPLIISIRAKNSK